MRFGRRRSSRPPRGEYPPSFTHAWIRQTLPTASAPEARALLQTMRDRGWTETEVAERILPYMPPMPPAPASGDAPAGEAGAVSVLARVSAVLPKLPPADANALLAGLRELGMTEEEIARLSGGAGE